MVKAMAMAKKPLYLRALRNDDLTAVVEIDELIRGVSRPGYWKGKFAGAEIMPPWASLVAEVDDHIAGFVFGWSGNSEFGVPGEVAWIDIIGVHPAYRRRGVALALVDEFTRLAKELRKVEKVFTLVDPEESGTASFFSGIGFRRGRLVHMER
jgi:ribosomal protein S18 acetylase RimI-like enzyme